MRRIKSAPANLSNMANRKKMVSLEKKNVFLIPKKETPNTNYTKIKNKKLAIKNACEYLLDFTNETCNLNLEENNVLYGLSMLFSERILKQDKFKEAYNIILKMFIRYLIMLFIHTQILHDKVYNIQYFTNNLHYLYIGTGT